MTTPPSPPPTMTASRTSASAPDWCFMAGNHGRGRHDDARVRSRPGGTTAWHGSLYSLIETSRYFRRPGHTNCPVAARRPRATSFRRGFLFPCGYHVAFSFCLTRDAVAENRREPNSGEPRILPVDELRQHFLGACCPPATIVMKRPSAVPRDARASLPPSPPPPTPPAPCACWSLQMALSLHPDLHSGLKGISHVACHIPD